MNPETEKLIENHAPQVRNRARCEVEIIRKVIADLSAKGYSLAVDNGGCGNECGTPAELIAAIMAVDEARLLTLKAGRGSFVFFVMGNDGHDVICDYGVSLEADLAEALALAEHYADGGAPYTHPIPPTSAISDAPPPLQK